MPAANIIQLRALLSEKFPGLRMRLDDPPASKNPSWPTGLSQLDQASGGFPKGALTEIVTGKNNSGSATLLHALLARAAVEKQIIAAVDGNDSLDVASMDESVLSRLLWVRCRSAGDALKSADLILRDNNFSFVALDLKINPESQLRKIPPTTWYRFQRLIEHTSTVCAVFTPRPIVGAAQTRVTIHSAISSNAREHDADGLLREMKMEISHAGQLHEQQHFA